MFLLFVSIKQVHVPYNVWIPMNRQKMRRRFQSTTLDQIFPTRIPHCVFLVTIWCDRFGFCTSRFRPSQPSIKIEFWTRWWLMSWVRRLHGILTESNKGMIVFPPPADCGQMRLKRRIKCPRQASEMCCKSFMSSSCKWLVINCTGLRSLYL